MRKLILTMVTLVAASAGQSFTLRASESAAYTVMAKSHMNSRDNRRNDSERARLLRRADECRREADALRRQARIEYRQANDYRREAHFLSSRGQYRRADKLRHEADKCMRRADELMRRADKEQHKADQYYRQANSRRQSPRHMFCKFRN